MGLVLLITADLQSRLLSGLVFVVQDPEAGEPDVGLGKLTPVGELLKYNYPPVCRSPIWRVWDLIISGVHPLQSCCGWFFMSLDIEYLFW